MRHRRYDGGIPQLWGPGPWDDDPETWDEKSNQCSDLRPATHPEHGQRIPEQPPSYHQRTANAAT